MHWHRLKLSILAGSAALFCLIAVGATELIVHGGQVALTGAERSLEQSARAVETSLNRQLLQVHGALASLPSLFAAANASPASPAIVGELLRGLNFQTLAYRDLLLVGPDGNIVATARPHAAVLPLPFDIGLAAASPTNLIGPVRNGSTGEWSVYVARNVPGWAGYTTLAEVPLRTLMELLAETGIDPRVRLYLERPSGELIAAIPHDEIQTGRVRPSPLGFAPADGTASLVPTRREGEQDLVVARTSLFDDVRVVLAVSRNAMLGPWHLDRDRIFAAAIVGGLVLLAFTTVLLMALRQRERAESERARSATILMNAIDAMSDGFAMWDSEDRLVTCNQRYRDLNPTGASSLEAGTRFEDVARREVAAGKYAHMGEDPDALVHRLVAEHQRCEGSSEWQLRDGRWVLVKERRTADGGIVGIRTDITVSKATLAELAEAHARANQAAAEAQRQNTALTEREARIRYLAHHDDLTGLPNRIQFRANLEAALDEAAEHGTSLALLYLDLDRFKDVNDTLGHPVGDALLRTVAERLRQSAPAQSIVARLGGDEFAVLCPLTAETSQAEALSRLFIARLSEPYSVYGHAIVITSSVGIAIAAEGKPGVDELFKQADVALYQAKARGRSTACVFVPEMGAGLQLRLELEADLRQALEAGEFQLAYQPIYGLATGRLSGFEALLRWHHPKRGSVPPETFVPLAEDTGLIVDIGSWVLRQACNDLDRLPGELKVAVNLSPVEFALGDIVGSVRQAIAGHHIAPGRLELEITETALFADDQRNLNALHLLRAAGARIVLDDFGTGFSSLSHLHRFPLDKVKIDRSFVQDMTRRADSTAIVEAIAALALRLGKSTTAEGIETAAQFEAARHAGCTEAQGYYLGVPKPFADALELARRQAAGSAMLPA